MSLSNVYSQMFSDMFELDYQGMSRLKGTTMERHGIVGDALKLKVMDAVPMSLHGAYGSDIPASNVTVSAPSLTFQDFPLKLSLDMFESLNINANVLQPYARTIAESIGRQEDQLIIDAADAGAGDTVAVNVSGAATNLTLRKLREARKILGTNEVGTADQLYLATHANNLHALLSETEPGSRDYNDVQALINGELRYFYGFNIITLGDRTCPSTISGNSGGLPKTGDNRTNYAWSQRSIMLGYRMDPTVTLTYVENQRRYETVGTFSAGAKVQLSKGVVKIICDETKD